MTPHIWIKNRGNSVCSRCGLTTDLEPEEYDMVYVEPQGRGRKLKPEYEAVYDCDLVLITEVMES
jgi:hypothetical protein